METRLHEGSLLEGDYFRGPANFVVCTTSISLRVITTRPFSFTIMSVSQ
jgi:hypothetical protein